MPVVVLSRSQTGQQVYRWFQLLQHELEVQGEVDAGMLTFVSSDIEGQRTLMKALPNSPLYLTGSREVRFFSSFAPPIFYLVVLWCCYEICLS